MYYRVFSFIGIFLSSLIGNGFAQSKSETFQRETACAPNVKAVELTLVKQKSEIRKEEESSVLLQLRALRSVSNVTVNFNFSKGLKAVPALREVKIAKIDSGKVEAIPLPITALKEGLQSVRIEVKGKMKNQFAKGDVDFQTGDELGMLFNEQTKNFELETSFESMTKAYRVWNLVPEETLRARGHSIVFQQQMFDSNFQQAKPVEPIIKRMKSLNHKAAFTEVTFEEDTNNTSLEKGKSKTFSTNTVQSQVCVTVTGNLYYENSGGQYVPLPNATVDIWEEDTFSDDYLTSTITDQSGHFSVSLCDNDGLGDSHLELYAILATANDRVRVLNYTQPGESYGFNAFWWATGVIETGGGTVDYGNLLISSDVLNRGGAKIFDNIQRAWSASVARGFNPSYTPVVYPAPTSQCDGSSCYSYQTFPSTSLGAIYLQSGEWLNGNEDIAYHEYGHALMHRAYADAWHPNTDGGNHNQLTQPVGFAWNEGWATFYTQVVNNDGSYNTVSGSFNLEDISWMNGYPTGDVNEWRVAQAMTDLYDTYVDGNDQSVIAFNKFISTMQSNNSNSLTEFWNQLKNSLSVADKYYGSRSLIYNTIPVTQETVPPLSISISGPSLIFHPTIKGQTNTYTWSANITGGASPFAYQWKHNSTIVGTGSVYSLTLGYAGSGGNPIQWTLGLTITDAIAQAANATKPITEGYEMRKRGDLVEQLPNEFSLSQNMPNPFNPSTIISYALPEGSFVSIKIYNSLGEEITTLVNDYKAAGLHSINWSATNLSSGLYFYRIQAGKFSTTKKMLLTK